MSDIDFQNGFIVGMATKGLSRSGELYKPLIWNDDGVYTYFYIDFRRTTEAFSTGMWNESIVIHDSEQIKATGVQLISPGVYKIFCDISNRPHGITVLNKKVSRLKFASGEQIPVFSIHMFILGQPMYEDAGYFYSQVILPEAVESALDSFDSSFWENTSEPEIPLESCNFPELVSGTNETVSIVLT